MNDEIRKYLLDIFDSIENIEEFIGSINNFLEYSNNKMLTSAVERQLAIIGEAMNKILKKDSSLEISNARKIISFRNFIIHSYDNVENEIIWGIVKKHLPLLKKEIQKLIE